MVFFPILNFFILTYYSLIYPPHLDPDFFLDSMQSITQLQPERVSVCLAAVMLVQNSLKFDVTASEGAGSLTMEEYEKKLSPFRVFL